MSYAHPTSTVRVKVGVCAWCMKDSYVDMTPEQKDRYAEWKVTRNTRPWDAKHVQEVFADLSAGEREQLITGTHNACWGEMLPAEED